MLKKLALNKVFIKAKRKNNLKWPFCCRFFRFKLYVPILMQQEIKFTKLQNIAFFLVSLLFF